MRPVTTQLDLGKLSDADKATLADQVRTDVAETKAFPADTYFGGKALYRAACSTSWPPARADDAATRSRPRADRTARPVDRPAGLRGARRSASSTTRRARVWSG